MEKVTKKSLNAKTNQVVQHVIESAGSIQMRVKLKEIAEDRGLNQMDVVRLTGIGQNMINGLWNNRAGVKIGYAHIFAIMIALRVTEIADLLEIVLPQDKVDQYTKESDLWVETKSMPASVQQLLKENKELQ